MTTTLQSTSVALFGTGALGTALGKALLVAEVPLTVWNRTPARAAPLIESGATPATSPSTATEKVEVLVVAAADHSQAADVVERAVGPGGFDGRVVLTLTSGTPEQATDLDRLVEKLGGRAVHGAAMSGTRLVGDPTATFLYSGDHSAYDRIAPVRRAWGGSTFVGTDAGLASLYDTALLGLNLGLLSGAYQAMALLGTAGIDPVRFAEVARGYLPFAVDLVADHAGQLASGEVTDDDGTLEVYREVVDHLVETSESRGLDATGPRGLAGLIDLAVERGYGATGLPALVPVIAGAGR